MVVVVVVIVVIVAVIVAILASRRRSRRCDVSSDRSHNSIGGRVPAGHALRDGGIVRKGEVGALHR